MISARFRSEDYFLKDFLTVREAETRVATPARSLDKISGQDLWARSLGSNAVELNCVYPDCARTPRRVAFSLEPFQSGLEIGMANDAGGFVLERT
jgi:hypothetical protein